MLSKRILIAVIAAAVAVGSAVLGVSAAAAAIGRGSMVPSISNGVIWTELIPAKGVNFSN